MHEVGSRILYELRFNDIPTSLVQFLLLPLKIQIGWLLAKRSFEDHGIWGGGHALSELYSSKNFYTFHHCITPQSSKHTYSTQLEI